MDNTEYSKILKTGNDVEFINACNQQIRLWSEFISPYAKQWRINASYALGQQWSSASSDSNKLLTPPMPEGRNRLTDNLIKPFLLDMEAKLRSVDPRFEVFPTQLDREHRNQAIICEGVLEHFWRTIEFPARWSEIIRLILIMGNAFGVLSWDEEIGPTKIKTNEEGEQNLEPLGDLTFQVYSPLNVVTNCTAGPLDRKTRMMTMEWIHIEELANMFKKGREVDEKSLGTEHYHLDAIRGQATASGSRLDVTSKMMKGANLIHVMEQPNANNPEGIDAYYANDTVLQRDIWKYSKLTGFPVEHFMWYCHPHHFHATAPLDDQLQLQRRHNKGISQIYEHIDTMCAGKYLSPFGSLSDPISDMSGQVIEYAPGYAPSQMDIKPIPAHMMRMPEFLLGRIRDMQMRNEASRGQNPPGSRSGSMLYQLREADDRPLSVIEWSLENNLSKFAQKILQIVSEKVTEERQIRYIGRNNRRTIEVFKGMDLEPGMDVYVDIAAGQTKSKEAIIDAVMQMYQNNMIVKETGIPDSDRALKMIRHALPRVLYEDIDRHRSVFFDDIEDLWDKQMPITPPDEYWRVDIGLDMVEEEMLSPKWRETAAQDPEFIQLWQQYRLQLKTIQEQLQNPQATPQIGGAMQAPTQQR